MIFFNKKSADKNNSFHKVPHHIAIIMDGNARWAKSKNLSLQVGHKVGSENLLRVSENCIEFGIKFLSVYAFSSENWNRPKKEVDYLMKLLEEYLEKESSALVEKGIKVIISGNMEKVLPSTREKINQIEHLTKDNSDLTLNVAFSYGARQEIVDATKKIVLAVKEGIIDINSLSEDLITDNLYHPEVPDPDLLIRTAGDIRLSNFLLWQLAYSELYFTEVYWPDFKKEHLFAAIESFNKRERRYGAR